MTQGNGIVILLADQRCPHIDTCTHPFVYWTAELRGHKETLPRNPMLNKKMLEPWHQPEGKLVSRKKKFLQNDSQHI